LGGLSIAIKAYKLSLNGKAPVMDGYTGIRECFLGWGQVWLDKAVKSNTQSNCFRSTFIAKFKLML
jgi:predicted metalloendopeptidase